MAPHRIDLTATSLIKYIYEVLLSAMSLDPSQWHG